METPIVPRDDELLSLVYEPAEDSFLLLDALEQDLPRFLSSFGNTTKATVKDELESPEVILALEVGCGSGIISTALAKYNLLANRMPLIFAADVNPSACQLTFKTAQANGIKGAKVQPLLLDGRDLSGFRLGFDLIVCNPPYVPVHCGENPEDSASGLLEKSWTGGEDGNSFISPFLSKVGESLSEFGILYLLLSSWNKPLELMEKVAKPAGLNCTLVIKRAAGRERLSVYAFSKNNSRGIE